MKIMKFMSRENYNVLNTDILFVKCAYVKKNLKLTLIFILCVTPGETWHMSLYTHQLY